MNAVVNGPKGTVGLTETVFTPQQAQVGFGPLGVWGGLLAAGLSTRMGRSKALIPFGDETLLERAFAALIGGGVNHVLVCLRAADLEAVKHSDWWVRAVDQKVLSWVCPRGEPQLSSSVRLLCETQKGKALLLHQVDRPFVTKRHVAKFLEDFGSHGSTVVAQFQGTQVPPILLPNDQMERALPALAGDRGMAPLFASGVLAFRELDFTTDILFPLDVDTPADLERALSLAFDLVRQVNEDCQPNSRNKKE